MTLKSILYKLLLLAAIAYLAICAMMYFMQKSILFPTDYVSPVLSNWAPSGKKSEQSLQNGSCGKLHMAIWRTPLAKGTIMMFHGNGESLASIDGYIEAFHRLGYNLMAWDYPGYGQSTDCAFSQSMLLSDAETAYQWLKTKESKNKIHLFGYSLGTGIALYIASKHQENPVYLVAGYDALSEVAKDRFSSYLPVDWLFKFPMQTKNWINAIRQPIYLIHGTQDQIILPARAKRLQDSAPDKIKLEWVKHAGHADTYLFEYRNQWLKRLLP